MTSPLVSAWTKLCHHCDGIAFGTTAEALLALGAFDTMRAGAFTPASLARAFSLQSGFTAVAIKLLRSQGFAQKQGESVVLTPDGAAFTEHGDLLHGACARIHAACELLRALAGTGPAPAFTLSEGCIAGPLRWRMHQQALGPLAAASWFGLHRRGLLDRLIADCHCPIDEAEIVAFSVMENVGWTHRDSDRVAMTPEGMAAASLVSQYAYPLSYLSTFASVGRLLREGTLPPLSGTIETHVDRSLDIAFSGVVFNKSCREPFLEIALPLFDTADPSTQPRAIVDTGSGDGTVLAALFEAVRDNSRRGYSLATHPLTLIGVEFNEVARHATQERLAAIGAPYLAISGDIAKPDLIAQQLTANGIDPFDVLHVNKSVIHNRAHCQTVEILPSPMTDAVFTDRSGGSISADESFSALVALFERWAPYLARHGMISIEAHTVSPERAARHIGRSLITSLDAPHGYSSQYLMEIHTHRMAADKAGLVRLSQRDLGAAMMGDPIMSIDHLRLC